MQARFRHKRATGRMEAQVEGIEAIGRTRQTTANNLRNHFAAAVRETRMVRRSLVTLDD